MGSKASVHVGCLLQEYSQISQRDSEMPGTYQIVGSSGLSMLANRLSWFYDFTGPSMTVDTACSGSLLALHLACQDLLTGSVDMVSLFLQFFLFLFGYILVSLIALRLCKCICPKFDLTVLGPCLWEQSLASS